MDLTKTEYPKEEKIEKKTLEEVLNISYDVSRFQKVNRRLLDLLQKICAEYPLKWILMSMLQILGDVF